MMKKLSRRSLLLWGGAGAAATAAGVAVPAVTLLAKNGKSNIYAFHAVAGLPAEGKLPNYCSMVYDGHVDLTAKTGTITRVMHAGYPQGTQVSPLVWTGFSESIRVTDVKESGSSLTITGVVDDRSQVKAGENASVTIQIDRSAKTLSAPFYGATAVAKVS
jgi:methyl coenzyme M reductase alpha subunit